MFENLHGETPRTEGSIDRTPPQDMAAEQSVLGAMLMSKTPSPTSWRS